MVSRKELLLWPSGAVVELANVNVWVKFLSRNSEVFKIYTNYLSCLVYNQVYNLFVLYLVSLFDFIPTMKLRHANYNEIPARSTCHMSHERTVLDLIALRKHDTAIISHLSCEKKSISNLHVVDMPLNEPKI